MDNHEGHATHEHHWEWSYYPLILVAGIFFTVPIAFALFFQYENGTGSAISLGIGLPLLIWGCAGWMGEGLDNADNEPGYALTGLPVFIISEVMLFLALFVSYWVLRLSADVWPPAGSPHIGIGLPIIMTIILVSSSITYHFGEMRLEEGDKGGFINWLMITIMLGLVFLGCSIYEYNHLIHEGFVFSTNAKSTAFYSITGFHASHVVIGLALFVFQLIPGFSGRISHTYATAAGIYWHFVDIVWFFVVSQVYFW